MANANHIPTPESVKPALSDLDPVRRQILWTLAHLPLGDQALFLKISEALAGKA